jgi:hypothetical protein
MSTDGYALVDLYTSESHTLASRVTFRHTHP